MFRASTNQFPRSRTPLAGRRRLGCERLERRNLFALAVCNPFNPFDVDDDGRVIPQDALQIINELNLPTSARGGSSESQALFMDVNDDGSVSPIDALLVIDHLQAGPAGDPPLVAALSPESDPNGNGVVLRDQVRLQGQTALGARVRLTREDGSVLTVAADSAGRFEFEIGLQSGINAFRLAVVDPNFRASVVDQEVRLGDVVLDWNAAMLNIVRDWTTLSNDPYPNRIVTSQPPMVARNLAMVHAAIFDAINGVSQVYEPYRVSLSAPDGTSPVAAAAAAARRVASQLYREADELAVFDAGLAEALATVPDETAAAQGVTFGEQVGDAILAWRANDGAAARVNYVPGTEPGAWRRTFPDYFPPLLPQWPQVRPFAMSSADQFRVPPPPALDSLEYARDVDEVMRLGALGSTERTAAQTEIALFWADGGGTFTPPGHWNQIAADAGLQVGHSLLENARTLALVNIALADAGIASWDAKYFYNLWRPIDAIRQANLDGNPLTSADPSWTPLLRTPPFPSYTSGHSTFSGAASVVLTSIFGEDFSFTSRMDGQRGFTQRPLAEDLILTRSFTSFEQAAKEASRSRIYGGIHFEFDGVEGLAAGRQIGELIVQTLLPRRD